MTAPEHEEAPVERELDEGSENHLAAGLAQKATRTGIERARANADQRVVRSMTRPTDSSCRGPSPDIRDAANNAVAVASLAYQQEVTALSTVLACAHGHGLTVHELVSASGFDETFILRLIEEIN